MMGKKIRPRRNMAVDVTILSDPYATVAQVSLLDTTVGVLDGGLLTATGSAKKEPGDVYDPVIDADLAVGRALVHLGERMISDGNRAVRRAVLEQQKKTVCRKLHVTRPKPRHAKPLSVEEIRADYGEDAARKSLLRRGPQLPA